MGWISIISAQSLSDNFKIAYPGLVHQGKPFEVSIITSNEVIQADRLDLYIITQHGILPSIVFLQTEGKTKEIKLINASTEGFLYDAVMCSIDLPKSVSAGSGSFFQIIIKFNTEFIEYSEIDFYGEFRRNGIVVDYLKNSDESLISDYPNYHRLKINLYSSTINGNKALLFQPQSEFTVLSSSNIENNLLADFWLNFDDKGFRFLEITNKQTGLNEFSLIINEFQIIVTESDFNREKRITPQFISKNVWSHFSLLFSYDKNEVEFYCNNKQIAVFHISGSLIESEIEFSFINNGEGSFQLDQFRILDFNEPAEVSFTNSNFADFISDKSFIKQQFSFNKTSLSELMQLENVLLSNCALVSSDAPIFSRAPELNLKIMNNYYELTWVGGDFVNASAYVLEQAESDKAYREIYKTDADNVEEKTYSFLSERRPNTDVVYFRVKQIIKNGSVVYSSQIKVGQGDLEEFIIGQNYPNPFNPKTQISIEVLVDSDFNIVVYNLEGKRISVLHEGFLAAGLYQFTFDGSDLPSGIYLYKAWSPNFSQTKKMILAK